MWSVGKGKMALAYASSHTCYLGEVHGGFKTDSDSIRVWPESGRWYAQGQGAPGSFTVNCFRKEFAVRDSSQGVDGIVTWIRGGDPVGLGLVQKKEGDYRRKRMCFLTEIKGPLQDPGDGVALLQLNDGWVLSGSRGGPSPGPARVAAVCVTWLGTGSGPNPAAPELKWAQGEPKKAFPMGVFRDLPCALTRIAGPGEWVGVWREGQTMWLGGWSSSLGFSGGARCLDGEPVFQGP